MITTLNAAIAGARAPFDLLKVGTTMEAAGVLHSLFYTSGSPGAAVAPTPGLGGEALTAYAGSLPFVNPAGGAETKLYRLSGSASQAGKLIICDRLWHNSSIAITTTTAQTVNSVTWPARCPAGANPNTNGNFIMVGLEASAAIGGGAVTNTTISYTDSDGNASATGTMASWPATAQAGTFVPFQLAAGDTGIRSLQTLTLGTSYVSGTVHLVAYRKLVELEFASANVGAAVDFVTSAGPRMFDSSVLFLMWMPSVTTAVTFGGAIAVTQG